MSNPEGAGQALNSSVSLPTGTVTFLFSDIEGSTQRWEQHREAMKAAVARHDQIMTDAIAQHRGCVFKTVGDAFCAAFSTAQEALGAAIDAQLALAKEDFASVDGLRARMGLHTGHAEEQNADYFGPTVNRVARLMSIGHGGQVLLSSITRDLAHSDLPTGASLIDLGSQRLKDLTEAERVWQLNIAGLPAEFPPLKSLDALPNNLPNQPTNFCGRELDLEEVKSLLAKHQLLTIVGAGGVGKTRLALQVSADLLDHYPDGVWLADLAPITDPELVSSVIAKVLGMGQQEGRRVDESIPQWLKRKKLLLILDNCEHLLEATASIADAIMRNCTNVRMLATSRQPLGISGEVVHRLPSLAMPDKTVGLQTLEALKYSAIALFVDRAKAADTRFALSDATAPIVAEICRRLDGIALAIELAAARVTMLNVNQLSQRLDERFRLLTGGDRAALPRQQSMRAAIDWSYGLLSEDEQTFFRRLSIFQGGWTLESACAICADESNDEAAIFDHLSSLVNKSLVVVDFDAETQRYRLLESLRQYGVERLKDRGEFDTTARRHAQYYAEFGRREADRWHTIPHLVWLATIDEELDNIRAALNWSLEQGKDPLLGAELAERLWVFWFGRTQQEGKRWISAAQRVIDAEDHPALSVALDLAMTRMLIWTSRQETFVACERALSAARALGDETLLARAAFYYGEWLVYENRLEAAEPPLKESLGLAQRAGDRYRAAAARQLLGKLYIKLGKLDVARQLLSEALQTYGKTAIERNRGLALVDFAALERREGNLKRAIDLAREGQGIAQALRDRNLEMIAQSALALYQIMSGQFDDARSTARSTLELCRQERLEFGIAAAAEAFASLATQQGDFERAALLLGYAEANFPKIMARDAFANVDLEWFMQPLREHLDQARLQALMSEGAAWPEAEAIEEALKV